MPPDWRSSASPLPGERTITLFAARLCPEKRLEKQPVSLVDGIPGQSDCNARRNYESRATCRGSTLLSTASARLHGQHGILPLTESSIKALDLTKY
ncbi:hypothetical protein CesoFtcFv8_002885 [Champsocephalus esox]|uniref:Uncharacterized protein n=1 Tax=Champsocephalus esox TaxID=159716 RepID=A0AAN8D403_9TELE|nr:hypothetical protein CesoFtcFv8_002885 [Champsocephalus esox]